MRQNHTTSSKTPRPTVKARHKRTQGSAEASKTAVSLATKPARVEVALASTLAAPPRDGTRVVSRFDRPGHLAREHAERLLRLSRRDVQKDREQGFDWGAGDDLAAELGEFAVISMVGGGETWLDLVDGPVEEDDGGPFVETQSSREFAPGSDEDSEGFLREALPTSSALPKGANPEFRRRRRS
jgi:hypothetical protein